MTENLTIDRVLPYLLERGLVRSSDVVDGHAFRVQDRTRRNRNFLVNATSGSLLVKQAGSAFDPESVETLDIEASLLRAVAVDDVLTPVRWFAPRFVYHDPDSHVLVLEQVRPATSLTKFHLGGGTIDFAVESAITAGRIIARFHRAMKDALRVGALGELPLAQPFAFNVPEYVRNLVNAGDPVASAFGAAVEATDLFDDSIQAQTAWTAGDGVVHGDVRWDNFLVTSGSAPGDNMNLRLIDWELTRRGDEYWDVVAYLAEYLRYWAMSASMLSSDPEAEAASAFTFAECHASADAFVGAYARARRLGREGHQELLDRIGVYLPYALAVVAFETTQQQSELPLAARLLVDKAAYCRTQPGNALRDWFGLEGADGNA